MVIKRERVMIACVTTETFVVSDPVTKYNYNPDRLYLIHYDDHTEENRMYVEFYEQAVKLIGNRTKIIDCNKIVYLFDEMLKTLLSIINHEEKNDVYINVTSGTSEFSAAAIIASMMYKSRVFPFTISAQRKDPVTGEPAPGFTLPTEKYKKLFYNDDGEPVGQISITQPPRDVTTFELKQPKQHLIIGLKFYIDLEGDTLEVCKKLYGEGVWFRKDPETPEGHFAVNFSRDYVANWIKEKWVTKNENTKKIELTETGKTMLRLFYFDEKVDYLKIGPGEMTNYDNKFLEKCPKKMKGLEVIDHTDKK